VCYSPGSVPTRTRSAACSKARRSGPATRPALPGQKPPVHSKREALQRGGGDAGAAGGGLRQTRTAQC
jgi:hypothetical protein